jgi:hypothetical protein
MAENATEGFLVEAISAARLAMWAAPVHAGTRLFGSRENAEVFATAGEARIAISEMDGAFNHTGEEPMIGAQASSLSMSVDRCWCRWSCGQSRITPLNHGHLTQSARTAMARRLPRRPLGATVKSF